MVCQSLEQKGFKGTVEGLSISQVPCEKIDTDFFSLPRPGAQPDGSTQHFGGFIRQRQSQGG